MAGKQLSDNLWEAIEYLVPMYEVSQKGGRRPIPDRTVLTPILFVL
jgi:hypothetical protein